MGKETSKKIDYKLVWEKEFKKEIQDVRFGETEDGKLYPKIVVFEDEVRFYDDEGNLTVKVPYKGGDIIFSRRANYIGIQIEKSPPAPEKGPTEIKFSVYSEKGEKLLEIEKQEAFDVPAPDFYISSSKGNVIELYKGLPRIAFRDSSGKVLKQFRLFEEDAYDITRGARGDFSEDGEDFVVIADEYESVLPRSRSRNTYMMLFTKEGKELWRYQLEEQNLDFHVSISPTGQFVVGASKSGVYLLNKEGNLISKYRLGVNSGIRNPYTFSSNEEYAVLSDLHEVVFIRTSMGEVLWRHVFGADATIRGVSFSRDNVGIMLEIKSENYLSAINVFNQNGEMIVEKHFSEKIFPFDYFRREKAKISSDGKEIGIISKKGISLYQKLDQDRRRR